MTRATVPGREPYRSAAATLLRESGCVVVAWRASRSGIAYTKDEEWAIEVPAPSGPVSFGVFAHEVGHQLLHRDSRLSRWREEVEAEEYALAAFDRFDLPGRDRYEARVEGHLAQSFARAIRRSPDIYVQISRDYPRWWRRVRVGVGLLALEVPR